MRPLGWAVRLAPIVFFMTYLGISVAAFAYGPWPYPVKNWSDLREFLILVHLALFVGYLSGAGARPGAYSGRAEPAKLVRFAAIASLVLLVPTSLLNNGSPLPNVVAGITNPGEVYAASQTLRISDTPWAAYLRMFVGPWLAMLLPLTVVYWRRLSVGLRLFALLGLLGNVALFVAIGTNQGVLIPVLLAPWLLVAGQKSGLLAFTKVKIVGMVLATATFMALGLSFFATTMAQREGSGAATGSFAQIGALADFNSPIVAPLPRNGQILVLGLTGYLGQGYYGLSLALDKPFVPMYGIGHSTFVYRQVARLSGDPEIAELAYPERISKEDGWTAVQFFQTLYPWIASDVGFPGTIVVIFLLGRTLALVWVDALGGRNPYAFAFLAQLLVMMYYLPALNAALQGGEGFAAFWGLALMWAFTRKRYVWGRSRSLTEEAA